MRGFLLDVVNVWTLVEINPFISLCYTLKKAPSGEMGQNNSLIMECSVLWSVENEMYFTSQKCSQFEEIMEFKAKFQGENKEK